MRTVYQVGDLIIYGSCGVCKVEAVGKIDFSGIDNDRIYYTLCPFYQNGTIFAPIDTGVFMRPIITNKKAQQLIALIPSIRENVYDNSNARLLGDQYQESIQTYDCVDLIKVIKTVYTKKVITINQGKKLGQVDENFMKKAEELLYGEFAVALGIQKDNVKNYIEEKIEELDKKVEINS